MCCLKYLYNVVLRYMHLATKVLFLFLFLLFCVLLLLLLCSLLLWLLLLYKFNKQA